MHLVFDRYYKCSVNGLTRAQRTRTIAGNHVLSLSTPIPLKEDTMLSTGNKVQIMSIISRYLIKKLENTSYRRTFVVTFSENISSIFAVASKREDFKKLHEEADINIIKQCMACVKDEVHCVKVICDDTDVFALLTVSVFWQGCKSKVLMEPFDTTQSLIEINETAKKHAEIVPSLIGAHALSGCDSVPKLYGVEKKAVTKYLKDQNLSLSSLGDTAASLTNVYAKSTKLISSCYGVKNANNLSEVRLSVWGNRTGKKLTSTQKL